jgi:hypothetical protein
MKTYFFIIILASLTWQACDKSAQKGAFTTEEVALGVGVDTIRGTLIAPRTENPPIVLLIAGSGPTDRNGNQPMMQNNSLKMIAEGLAIKGIASLRFDKRFIGQSRSTLSEADLRFETYVDDAAALLQMLKNDNRFSKLYVAGHSEGSQIAILAAQKVTVDGLISIAGIGKSADLVLLDQLATIPQPLFLEAKAAINSLKNGVMVEKFDPQLTALLRPSVQPYLISWFKYNPAEEIAKLSCPVLILQGTTDIQVGVEHAQMLAAAKPGSTLKIIEGMNHVLKQAEADRNKNMGTYMNPELPLSDGVLEAIVAFLAKK